MSFTIRMANKAFVGLTGPIGYHYDVEEEFGFPNPIIESPTALMLLYDEIHFAHPDLCPKNMRGLNYVKFLSDREDLEKYKEIIESSQDISDLLQDTNAQIPNLDGFKMNWDRWNSLTDQITPEGTERIDDHNKTVVAPGHYGTIKHLDNFYFDMSICARKDMDFISNSILDSSVRTSDHKLRPKLELTEQLIAKKIPNIQKREGPYVEVIDDLRKSRYLRDFRKKVEEGRISDLEKAKKEIEQEFDQYRNKALLDKHSKYNEYKSMASIVTSDINPDPITSTVFGVSESAIDIYQARKSRKNYGWASFLSQVEIKSSNPN